MAGTQAALETKINHDFLNNLINAKFRHLFKERKKYEIQDFVFLKTMHLFFPEFNPLNPIPTYYYETIRHVPNELHGLMCSALDYDVPKKAIHKETEKQALIRSQITRMQKVLLFLVETFIKNSKNIDAISNELLSIARLQINPGNMCSHFVILIRNLKQFKLRDLNEGTRIVYTSGSPSIISTVKNQQKYLAQYSYVVGSLDSILYQSLFDEEFDTGIEISKEFDQKEISMVFRAMEMKEKDERNNQASKAVGSLQNSDQNMGKPLNNTFLPQMKQVKKQPIKLNPNASVWNPNSSPIPDSVDVGGANQGLGSNPIKSIHPVNASGSTLVSISNAQTQIAPQPKPDPNNIVYNGGSESPDKKDGDATSLRKG